MSSKRMTFVLCNVDIQEVDKKYNTIKTRSSNKDTEQPSTYSYFDETRKTVKCRVTMNNMIGKVLPKTTNIHCYWCRHSFSIPPIGAPVKKDGDVYTVDGVFCSFNCSLAYIKSKNETDYLFNDSLRLLNILYYNLFSIKMEIYPAPSWRMLIEYGGDKTIEEFRDGFNRVEYKETGNYISNFPKQLPIGWLYEEKIKF